MAVTTHYPIHTHPSPLIFASQTAVIVHVIEPGPVQDPAELAVKRVLPLIGPSCGSVRIPEYLQWLSSSISLGRSLTAL